MGGFPQHGPKRRASLSMMGTLALAAVTATWSCGGNAADEGSWGGTIETLAGGGTRVVSPDRGLWSEGPAWRLEEDLRIGSFQSEGPYLFGQIGDVSVDGAGLIFVLPLSEIAAGSCSRRKVRHWPPRL